MNLEVLTATWLRATPDQRRTIGRAIESALNGTPPAADTFKRIIRRDEASRLLGVGPKRIDQLCRAGTLKRIYAPGTSRALGIAEASIRALTEQKEVSV